jgi:chlorite dismutase/heme-degrading monooxygenase HmoA
MERRSPPPTEEGWFALHDFRTVDWDAWADAPEHERERAIEEGREFLGHAESVVDVAERSSAGSQTQSGDAEEGASATYGILGHEADLLVMHLRPTTADVDALERQFEGTALARFTERTDSFVSVTEASGYSERARGYFEGEVDEESGLARYIDSRLEPTVPDMEHVCFYPMDKRRGPEQNWYDLSFEERAEHMDAHGEIGREYGGKVTQMITGAMGFDDWEWGVTLWADDAVQIKKLLYEMRFDPSTSKYAEFGPFYFGRRLAPGDLGGFLAGERVPTGEGEEAHDGEGAHDDTEEASGGPPPAVTGGDGGGGDEGDLRDQLESLGVYAGQPRGEEVYALVVYSDAEADEVFEEVRGLRANFDHYDTHVKTAVYTPEGDDGDVAVASLWETESAAETAAGFLSDLPGATGRAGEGEGWGTLGMFYQVKDDHREAFVDTFEEVGADLAEMDGHRETTLLVNREDDCDTFIDSRWDAREDAMAFFRSDDFRETVEWGREVLADRPRHVFLA